MTPGRPTTFTRPGLDGTAAAALLAESGYELDDAGPIERTLLDTFDGRLHAAGLRLELRKSSRLLLLLSDHRGASQLGVTGVPRVADDLLPGPFRERVAAVIGIRALLPRVTVVAHHATARLRDDLGRTTVVVELFHRAEVNGAGLPWVLEVAHRRGETAAERAACRGLTARGLQEVPGDLLDLALHTAAVDLAGFNPSPTVPLDSAAPAGAGYRAVLSNLADAIEAQWPGAVADLDPEFLHDLRIAIRRSRSVLGHGRRVLPSDVVEQHGEQLRWLGSVTGEVRDLDVLIIEWPRYVRGLGPPARDALVPVLREVHDRRTSAQRAMARTLRGKRARRLLEQRPGWLRDEGDHSWGPQADTPLGVVVARRLRRSYGRVITDGRAISETSPAEELHDLRKRAKRLRYLLECFGGVFPGGSRKDLVRRLKVLQDNLGLQQDAAVHADQLRQLARDLHGRSADAETLTSLGEVIAQLQRDRDEARARFESVFAAFDDGATAALVRSMAREIAR